MTALHLDGPNSSLDVDELSFRVAVDESLPSLKGCGDLRSTYETLGIPVGRMLSQKEAMEFLYGRIRDALTDPTCPAGHGLDIHRLHDQVLIRSLSDGMPLNPYFRIAEVIRDATRTSWDQLRRPADRPAWRIAVVAAKDCVLLSPQEWSPAEVRPIIFSRQYGLAWAVRTLRASGFDAAVFHGCPRLADSTLHDVSVQIDELVGKVGGLPFVDNAFTCLKSTYCVKQQRYHVVRRPRRETKAFVPDIPWGYLLNLAVKHVSPLKSPPHDVEKVWNDARTLAEALATAYDLDSYQSLLDVLSGRRLMEFFRKLVLFDHMYSLTQARPEDAALVLLGLLDWLPEQEAIRVLGGTTGQLAALVQTLLANGLTTMHPMVFTAEEVTKSLPGAPLEQVRRMLDIHTHEKTGPHPDFSTPEDIPGFYRKPLLRMESHGYTLVNPAWCAPAFLTSTLMALGKGDIERADENVGRAFERLVRKVLEARGVDVVYGEYWSEGRRYDVDAAVVTANRVIFFELKKKGLTANARVSNDPQLLIDITGSLLAAQVQLGRHELAITRTGSLSLEADGSTFLLELGNRKIDRVALTLTDYGALQDHAVVMRVIEAMARTDLHAQGSSTIEAKLQATREACSTLLRQKQDLQAVGALHYADPPFNYWFLSLGHLMVILDDVHDADSLEKELTRMRHVTTEVHDFYYDHHVMKAMGISP